jgi:hypothetical protein
MTKVQKKLFALSLFFAVFSFFATKNFGKNIFLSLGSLVSLNELALAEKESGNEREGNDDGYSSSSSASSSSSSETTTQVIKLPDQIVTKTIMVDVALLDSDKDGLPDESDPHPNIPEYLIVSDVNGNGIDDDYDLSVY